MWSSLNSLTQHTQWESVIVVTFQLACLSTRQVCSLMCLLPTLSPIPQHIVTHMEDIGSTNKTLDISEKLHQCWWTLICFSELASTWKCALRMLFDSFFHTLHLLLIKFACSTLCCINKSMAKHQQKLNLPQFSYGHGNHTFVDTSIEYLPCSLSCVRYWVRSIQQNPRCTRTQT
jgi:hypothetical protein